jgi:FkbM family methyltransferase
MNETNQDRTSQYLEIFNREVVIKSLINKKNPTIFDVGANNGDTLVEFKKWWPKSKVHCFEPQRECWEKLDEKVTKYNYSDVVINRYAVGSEKINEAIFYSHDITSGQSGLHKINNNSIDSIDQKNIKSNSERKVYENRLNHERTIKVDTLINYIESFDIGHIDLLKIDTQGYEPEVLGGLKESLSNVDVVITELMFYDFYERSLSFSDIEKFLLPAGFSLFDISHISKNPMNGRTDWVDVIYINDRLRIKSITA